MTPSKEMLSRIFALLNEGGCEYAVLRNYEGLPERNESRDIDIVISRASYKGLVAELVRVIDEAGWRIVTYLKSDRLITWVIGAADEDGEAELLQLDFFFDTSVFGIRLLSAEELLASRQFNGRIWHVGKEMEFLDKYLYDRAVGAQYPEKYRSTREAVESDPAVGEAIKGSFGVESVEACDRASSRKMLLHAFMRAPMANALRLIRFEYYRVANYFRSTGFSIGFTGPDGSGKTTVIDGMIERLGEVFRKAHVYMHFRPQLFGNLGDVAQSAGLKREVDRNYSDPHRGGRTGMIGSLLRLAYYSTDYIIGYWAKVKPIIRITRLAIFDRYYTDIICDSRRSRIYLPVGFLYWWGRLLIPSLDYNILLTASAETILARKRELDAEGIADINAKIDYLSSRPGYTKILNDSTPARAIGKILTHVFDCQHARNKRRILS